MGDTEIVDIEHIAPLQADNIPDTNQSHFCFSCEEPIVGIYCAACGQKNDNFRRSIFSLVKEFLASITALEGRIWRTWGALLCKPGKVAREFADGRRSHWSSPVRVYLAMSILLFGYIGISNTQILSLDLNVNQKPGVAKDLADISPPDLIMTGSLNMFATQKQINEQNENRNFNLIDIILKEGGKYEFDLTDEGLTFSERKTKEEAQGKAKEQTRQKSTSSNPIKDFQQGFLDGASDAKNTKEKTVPLETKKSIQKDFLDGWNNYNPEDSDKNSNEIETDENSGPWLEVNGERISADRRQKALRSFLKDPTRFNNTFSRWLPRVMFFMMPFTMLLGILFIRGRGNALLYDHLVHSAYIHAVTFFVLLLGLILGRIPWLSGGWIMLILFGYLFFYLPMSLKTMFKRGTIKTIWTSYSIGAIYLFIMLIVLMLLVALGIKDFVDPI